MNDFNTLTGNKISSCYDSPQNTNCGYNNELIDIGGRYWIAGIVSTNNYIYHWFPYVSSVGYSFVGGVQYSGSGNGVRPVIKLDKSVKITEGTGTATDPYIITR